MKKLILTTLTLVCAVGVFAQGTVYFNNRSPGSVLTRVYLGGLEQIVANGSNDYSDSTLIPGTFNWSGYMLPRGSNYCAQLLAAPGPNQPESALLPASPVTTFRSMAGAGFTKPIFVTLSNVPPDAEVATVEMVAWDNSSGLYPTWTEAREAWTQGPLAAGMSGTLNVSNIGGFVNPPPVLTGLQSFNLWWIHQPTIIKSPLTQTVETGTTVQLFVITDSPGPSLAYTWFLDTTNALPGVTNAVLQLTDVQPSQAGAYTVTVTNMGFAMTSAPAMLSVISAVDRKGIIALGLTGSPGSVVHVEYSDSLDALQWLSLADMTLNSETQPCFDLTQPLQTQRFYRAWQTNEPPPGLAASIAPAISLTGSIGSSVRIDYINAIGPTDAWVTLETVTLTNTPQLYVDVSASGQPRRLYRLVPVP